MPVSAAKPRIILVDDDPAVRTALQFSLEIDGFEVEAYASGEALDARAHLPSGGCCLVLDYCLPGMDGLQLLERLRGRHIAIPAILITTNPKAALRRRAALAGVAIVEKPLLTDALAEGVRQALAAFGAAAT